MYQIFCLHSLVSIALLEQFQLQDKQLLMEFKHVFTWSYKEFKRIPISICKQKIELIVDA
jgi:hypothetical protein